jgi:prephenate dehydratase
MNPDVDRIGMKVSIQGIRGAFHEEAARQYYKHDIEIVDQLAFSDVITSVESGKADAGIMAIENTISGTINSNYNLIKNSNLAIVGEVYLRIEQNLAVNRGVKIEELIQVESHYMAINQCREFFRSHPQIRLMDIEDTALSMKHVSEKKSTNVGAIGSKLAAEYYDLEIIAKGIETNKKNHTRFFILQNTAPEEIGFNKASIQFVLTNKKGALASALNLMCKYNVDLTKIESLPILGEPWHYEFYVDVLVEQIDDYQMLMEEMKSLTETLSVLGTYTGQIKKVLL